MQNKYFRYRDDKFLSSENLIEWNENSFTKYTPTITYAFQDNPAATPETKEDTIIQYIIINKNIICFYRSGHVRYSSDNGINWNESDKPTYDYYYGSGGIYSRKTIVGGLFDLKTIDGIILLSDNNGGIFKSTNGINWINLSSSLSDKYKYSIFWCNNSYFAVGITEYYKNKDDSIPFFILYKSNDLSNWTKLCEYDNSKYKSEMNMDNPTDLNFRQKYINMIYVNNVYYVFSTDSIDYLKIDATNNIMLDSIAHSGLGFNQSKTADILLNEIFYFPYSGNTPRLNIYDNIATYPFTAKSTIDLVRDIKSYYGKFPESYIKAWKYENASASDDNLKIKDLKIYSYSPANRGSLAASYTKVGTDVTCADLYCGISSSVAKDDATSVLYYTLFENPCTNISPVPIFGHIYFTAYGVKDKASPSIISTGHSNIVELETPGQKIEWNIDGRTTLDYEINSANNILRIYHNGIDRLPDNGINFYSTQYVWYPDSPEDSYTRYLVIKYIYKGDLQYTTSTSNGSKQYYCAYVGFDDSGSSHAYLPDKYYFQNSGHEETMKIRLEDFYDPSPSSFYKNPYGRIGIHLRVPNYQKETELKIISMEWVKETNPEPFYLYNGSTGINKMGESFTKTGSLLNSTFKFVNLSHKNNCLEFTLEKGFCSSTSIFCPNNDFGINNINKYSKIAIEYELVSGKYSILHFGYMNSNHYNNTSENVCVCSCDLLMDENHNYIYEPKSVIGYNTESIKYTKYISLDDFRDQLFRKMLTSTSSEFPATKYKLGFNLALPTNNYTNTVFRVYKIWLE